MQGIMRLAISALSYESAVAMRNTDDKITYVSNFMREMNTAFTFRCTYDDVDSPLSAIKLATRACAKGSRKLRVNAGTKIFAFIYMTRYETSQSRRPKISMVLFLRVA